jgi:probable HAF family extracellular repeat protein
MRLALALHFAVCLLTAAPIYQVVDLGSLSTATAVNSAGVAGGWSLNGASMHAMASNGAGAAQSLDPTHQSQAFGINDVGQVVGIRHDANGNAQATMWFSDGSATALGGVNSYALAINNSGVAAGSQSGDAVRFTSGGPVSVGVNAPWSAAYGINSSGDVAGTAQLSSGAFRAFTAPGSGPVTMLGTLGGMSSYGQAINSAVWLAGGSTTATGYLHAFLYAGGQIQDLGTLAGTGNSSAYGVNDFGQVVGYSQIAGGYSSAFLWSNGQLRDLNDLIASDTGWRLLEANAITNQGQIVGFGLFKGIERAFWLDVIEAPGDECETSADVHVPDTAIPEPGTWAMMAIGLAAGIKRYFNG